MGRSAAIAEVLEHVSEARELLDQAERRQTERRALPAVILEAAPCGWLGRVLATHVAPVGDRLPDSWVDLPDGSRARGWLVRAGRTLAVVVDQRSEAEIAADYDRRAAFARRGTQA